MADVPRIRFTFNGTETPEIRAYLDHVASLIHRELSVRFREEWNLSHAELREALAEWASTGTFDGDAIAERFAKRVADHD